MQKRLAHIIKYCMVILYTEANVISYILLFRLLNKKNKKDGVTFAFNSNETRIMRY